MNNIPDDLQKRTFSFAPGEETGVREPQDWWPCEPKTFVFHVPTHAMFELFPRPDKPPGDTLELTDFRTRLVHLCEEAMVPEFAELQRLGKEALLMCLQFVGLVQITDPTIPELKQD